MSEASNLCRWQDFCTVANYLLGFLRAALLVCKDLQKFATSKVKISSREKGSEKGFRLKTKCHEVSN